MQTRLSANQSARTILVILMVVEINPRFSICFDHLCALWWDHNLVTSLPTLSFLIANSTSSLRGLPSFQILHKLNF